MTLDAIVDKIIREIINPFIAFIIGLAVLVFIYGVLQTILNSENTEKQEAGKRHMLWGIIGIAIMVSAIGIIAVINSIWYPQQ